MPKEKHDSFRYIGIKTIVLIWKSTTILIESTRFCRVNSYLFLNRFIIRRFIRSMIAIIDHCQTAGYSGP